MVYDRQYGEQELNFEASGALWKASLVMRDRETDSWWSIMTSNAIGGELDGSELIELPISEKTTWADWSDRYPDTLVLSVDGVEHPPENHYDNYFASGDTFRDLVIEDDRLAPKEPIYSFFLGAEPIAVPHSSFEGGKLYPLDGGRKLFVHREPGSSMFASSRAWLLEPPGLSGVEDPEMILSLLTEEDGQSGQEIGGFDTFWYSWVAINESTQLLQ